MKVLEVPPLRAVGNIVAVTLEQTEITGAAYWVVTTRRDAHRQPDRRWFPDEATALGHAVEQADRLGLLLIDLRDKGALE